MLKDNPITSGYIRQASSETSRWYGGSLYTFLATGNDTAGRLSVIELTCRRGIEPPHTHTREDETFYVLEGHLTFNVGGNELHASPGSLVFLPRGVKHSWQIHSEYVRMLMIFGPSGLEGFFHKLSSPASDLETPPQAQLERSRILAVAEDFGLVFSRHKL